MSDMYRQNNGYVWSTCHLILTACVKKNCVPVPGFPFTCLLSNKTIFLGSIRAGQRRLSPIINLSPAAVSGFSGRMTPDQNFVKLRFRKSERRRSQRGERSTRFRVEFIFVSTALL